MNREQRERKAWPTSGTLFSITVAQEWTQNVLLLPRRGSKTLICHIHCGGYLIVTKGRICDRAVGVGLWNWKEQNKNKPVDEQNTSRSASVIYENTEKIQQTSLNSGYYYYIYLYTNLSQAYPESSVVYSSISFIQG